MALIRFLDNTDPWGQLMLAWVAGDEQAFAQLYAHYRGELYRFFLRQCGHAALAEELYQELWMRVIQSRQRYEHTARFSTWLYRIAHNLLMDHFRRHQPEVAEDDPDSLPGEDDNSPLQAASREELQARFATVLARLPFEQRQAFLLKEEAGLSLQDIADVCGTTTETVKSRLRYAVARLRKALKEAAA